MNKRRTAAEIIATHICYDMAEMSDYRYQPTRYASPAVYAIGDYYYCAPTGGKSGPKPWKWQQIGTVYNRPVLRAHMNDIAELNK